MIGCTAFRRLALFASVFAFIFVLANSVFAQPQPVPPPPPEPTNQIQEKGSGSWSDFDPASAGAFMVKPGDLKSGVGIEGDKTFEYIWWENDDGKFRVRKDTLDEAFWDDFELAMDHDKNIQVNYDADGSVTSTWLL